MPVALPTDVERLSLPNLHQLARQYPVGHEIRLELEALIARKARGGGAEPGGNSVIWTQNSASTDDFALGLDRKRTGTRRVGREKLEQSAVRRILAAHGVAVYDTSQPFRALITPGVPDLICFCPRRGLFFVEVKAPGGRPTPAQLEFRERCTAAGAQHVLGGANEVLTFLEG